MTTTPEKQVTFGFRPATAEEIAVTTPEAEGIEETHSTREVEEKLVKHLTDRFLGWRLPKDFHPDGGIMFMDVYDNGTEQGGKFEPTGTNLFTAEQAKEMFRFLLEHGDGTSIVAEIIHHLLQKAREEERERIEAVFQKHVPPRPFSLEDGVWLKRLLNKAFGHENIH